MGNFSVFSFKSFCTLLCFPSFLVFFFFFICLFFQEVFPMYLAVYDKAWQPFVVSSTKSFQICGSKLTLPFTSHGLARSIQLKSQD